MARTKISEFSATPGNNTDIDGINIAEGCAPSGINDAIRELMSQLKDFQAGTAGDSFNGPVGTTTAAAGAFTTLTTSSTVTHNGGTANGVAYLNGSKVLTTGSALVFDGTNLGLGVTPSAWGATSKAFQTSAGSIEARGASFSLNNNAYFNGSWKYITSAGATLYNMSTTEHQWYNAVSGTAGNAITFTQAMTLDASGNLLVGTTSSTYTASGRGVVEVGGGSTAIMALKVGGSGVGYTYHDGTAMSLWNVANGNLLFGTNNTERARIDSSGNLLVGTTSTITVSGVAGTNALSTATTNSWATVVRSTAANPYGVAVTYTGAAPNGTGNPFLFCNDTGALRAEIRSNGGIANYSGNNVNLSDRREKTNFAPAGEYLSKICAIPVQTFNYIDQNIDEDPGLTLGVVAQDVQAVAPELVMESNWGTEENPKMRLSIYQTDLQYALMKCIQELNAKVEAQAAEIAALKGQA